MVGIGVEVIDLWMLVLFDFDIIFVSVEKMGWVVIVIEVLCIVGFYFEILVNIVEEVIEFLCVFIVCVIGFDVLYFFFIVIEDYYCFNLLWVVKVIKKVMVY